MLHIIMVMVIFLFALWGLTNFIRFLSMLISCPHNESVSQPLVFLNNDDAEFKLRAAVEQQRWYFPGMGDILAVDCGLTEENRQICMKLSENYENIIICTPQDLHNMAENKVS